MSTHRFIRAATMLATAAADYAAGRIERIELDRAIERMNNAHRWLVEDAQTVRTERST